MHIAQLIDTLNWGGAQKLLITFAEAIRFRNVDLTVIALRHDTAAPFHARLTSLGIRTVTFPAPRLSSLPRIVQLTRFLRQERFDILHTHLTYANILGSLTGVLANTPVVATIHNIKRGQQTEMRQQLESWALRYATQRAIAVGHEVAKAHQAQLKPGQLVTIPNAVSPVGQISPETKTRLRRQLLDNISRPLIISVGRLTEQKGQHDLLTAFAQLRQHHPAAALAVVGEGEAHAALTAQIKALGLQGHAQLLGARTDVSQLLAASDIYVSASHWEGLSVAILEAMSAGLPVVATQVGDIPQVLVEGTGLLVPPRQPGELSAALATLLDDQALRLMTGQAARAHVNRCYSPSIWADRLLTVYQDVISANTMGLVPMRR